jgi:hypothetical protein
MAWGRSQTVVSHLNLGADTGLKRGKRFHLGESWSVKRCPFGYALRAADVEFDWTSHLRGRRLKDEVRGNKQEYRKKTRHDYSDYFMSPHVSPVQQTSVCRFLTADKSLVDPKSTYLISRQT